MRQNLLHHGYKELSYEIREIVEIGKIVEKNDIKISWENIGDPVAKGEKIPEFLKEILKESLNDDKIFGYCSSRGLEKTREYIASKSKHKLDKNDIIFFNGLGDAINKIYEFLSVPSRVLGPNPAYPTHSSAEATSSGSEHITYSLDPYNNWNPNLEEIENKVKYNPNITAILVINPDNPTGAIFKKEILSGIINIAKKYDLFVIFDEIYEKLIYDENDKILLEDIIGDVPGISMKGMSKDIPWPGGRCGWIEVYNKNKDENFSKYIDSIYASKMLEVCSTTMPQYVLPSVYEHPEFKNYTKKRIEKYKKRALILEKYLKDIKQITYTKPKGAFYASIVFNDDKISKNLEKIKFKNNELKNYIKQISENKRFDKQFCYHLLGSTGICVVPLSGFNCNYDGFRMTLLEEDEKIFEENVKILKNFIINNLS